MGQASFTYLSPLQLRLSFTAPPGIPVGSYSVRVANTSGQQLFEKKDLFTIIPPNWVKGVQVTPPVKAGGQSTLKVKGRDFSDNFVSSFRIEVDEPGIALKNLVRADDRTLTADISVSSGVAPGDYWMHLSANGQKLSPPYGSIIKVEPPQ